MTGKTKALIGLGIVVVLGVMVALALREDRGRAIDVRTDQVRRMDLVSRVSATGHIEAKRRVELRAEVPGRIVRLPVSEGQDVGRGDLLVVLDPAQYEAAVQQARAAVSRERARQAQARASFLQADRDADRFRRLQEANPDLVTAQEVERAVTEAEVQRSLWQAAEHAVEQAEAALREAEDGLAKTVIRSPMAGRITRLDVEEGETVIQGGFLDPLLMTISDLSVMEAVIEVDETDVPSISEGDSAMVEIDAFPGRRFPGRVTKVGTSSIIPRGQQDASGTSSQRAIDFEVRITLATPPEGIRPDLSTTADIVTATRSETLAIPITALTIVDAEQVERLPAEVLGETPRDGGAGPAAGDVEGVFVVEDDRARFRAVEVGVAGESHFEVLHGLEEGEWVIAGPYQAVRDLRDGTRVRVVSADTLGRRGVAGGSGTEPRDGSSAGVGESSAPGASEGSRRETGDGSTPSGEPEGGD